MSVQIQTEINLQDEVIDLYHEVKDEYGFSQFEEMIAYAVGVGIQDLQYPLFSKHELADMILTRREAEDLLGLSRQAFQKYVTDGRIKPWKEYGSGKGKVQLFWKDDLRTIFNIKEENEMKVEEKIQAKKRPIP